MIQSGFATRVVRGLTGRDPAADAHQELGLLGMALLLLALLSLTLTLWRMRRAMNSRGDAIGRAVVELAMVLWIGAMADFIFTPLLQNLLAAGYLWWVAGVAFHEDANAGVAQAAG